MFAEREYAFVSGLIAGRLFMLRFSLFVAVIGCQLAAAQQGSRTVYVVRNAETASGAADALSPTGQKRSQCLAETLKDSGIKQIFASDVKATQQTAEPLAKALKIRASVVPARDWSTLARDVLYSANGGNVLVVGDRNTVPVIIPRLQGGTPKPIAETEYDRMFVLTIIEGGSGPAATLRYCPSGGSSAAAQPSETHKPAATRSPSKKR